LPDHVQNRPSERDTEIFIRGGIVRCDAARRDRVNLRDLLREIVERAAKKSRRLSSKFI
jgi:hypothetical protein